MTQKMLLDTHSICMLFSESFNTTRVLQSLKKRIFFPVFWNFFLTQGDFKIHQVPLCIAAVVKPAFTSSWIYAPLRKIIYARHCFVLHVYATVRTCRPSTDFKIEVTFQNDSVAQVMYIFKGKVHGLFLFSLCSLQIQIYIESRLPVITQHHISVTENIRV